MQLRKDNEYGLFEAKLFSGGIVQINFEKDIYHNCGCNYEKITTYMNGRIIDYQEFYDEEDYDNYKETDKEILIRVCGDTIDIDKSSMIRIDNIIDRNEFIINNASIRNKLSYEDEKAKWDNISNFIKETKSKGYDYEQIKELMENILNEIKEK